MGKIGGVVYCKAICSLLILAGFVIGVFVGVTVAPVFEGDLRESCHIFYVGTSQDPATVWIGEVEMCGKDIKWGNVKEPITKTDPSSGSGGIWR